MLGCREEIIKETMNFYYMKYGHALAQKILPRESLIYNFVRLLLSYFRYYYKLTLSELCSGLQKDYSFYQKIMYHWSGGNGREIQNFVSPHHTCDIYKLGKIFGKVVLEKKI